MKLPIVIIVFVSGVALMFSPKVLNLLEPEDSGRPDDAEPSPLLWTWKDVWQSVVESGCSLPHANCNYRPYHRQCLSFVISNLIISLMSTGIFCPLYVAGLILPVPCFTLNSRIRIGRFDVLDE